MEEIWKEIDGYENYMVSTFGRVYNIKKKNILKGDIDCWGYHRVQLYNKHGRKHIKRNVLVARAFIPNPNNLPEVNHLDEDKSNNRVDNLKWCTEKENCNHGTRNKRISESKYKVVEMFTTDNIFVAEFNSVKKASEKTGIHANSIGNNCRGESKTAGGYIFRYKK